MVSHQKNKMRFDLQVIGSWIEPDSRVLDLGCGNGDLLAWLQSEKNSDCTGIEQDKEKALHCIARGLSVLQGDFNEEVEGYPDHSFDYIILSQTLQQVYEPAQLLWSLARVGKRVIVSFPNFSHYSIRLQLLFKGMAPKSEELPYSWYDTPNIRIITLADFRKFTQKVGYTIVKEAAIISRSDDVKGHFVRRLTNLRATYGIFIIEHQK